MVTLDAITRRQLITPVLIFERVHIRNLPFLKRYEKKLLFLGRLPVLEAVTLGRYWALVFLVGIGRPHYFERVREELFRILWLAHIDVENVQIADWFKNKGRLIIHVISRTRRVARKEAKADTSSTTWLSTSWGYVIRLFSSKAHTQELLSSD